MTRAIRALRTNEAPSWEVRQAQIDAEEREALRALRARVAEAATICIDFLDATGGDTDIEDGGDDEPSLCMAGTHLSGGLSPSTLGGDDREADEADDEEALGQADNVRQLALGPNTADGDATALETYGGGFLRSGHEDDEDSHDREGMSDDNGIADLGGIQEQGCSSYAGAL